MVTEWSGRGGREWKIEALRSFAGEGAADGAGDGGGVRGCRGGRGRRGESGNDDLGTKALRYIGMKGAGESRNGKMQKAEIEEVRQPVGDAGEVAEDFGAAARQQFGFGKAVCSE